MAALKGTATIELTNADGSKDIYKHDNMVTNAPADLCKSKRGEMATILKMMNNGDSYAKTLFGGILLFNDTLSADKADYFLPSCKIVGYASQDAYAGLDTARGSVNAPESGLQADGSYKFVWDFSTAQGNGVIKSLALCPNYMGQIGASQSVVASERKAFDVLNNQGAPFDGSGNMYPSGQPSIDGEDPYSFILVAVLDGVGYAVSVYNIVNDNGSIGSKYILNNGGILRLYRFDLGATKVGLSNKAGMATYIDYVDVQLPTDFTTDLFVGSYNDYYSCLGFNFLPEGKKLIVFPAHKKADIAVNETIKYLEIDMANNMSITSYTCTNTTAGTISYRGHKNRHLQYFNFFVTKDYILTASVANDASKLYVIKRADNTQVKEVKHPDGSEVTFSSEFMFYPEFYGGSVIVIGLGNITFSSDKRCYIVDLANAFILETNATTVPEDNNINIGDASIAVGTGPCVGYTTYPNPFVLTTKNNLDSPVTKTASQTMKITYTLTESEEP